MTLELTPREAALINIIRRLRNGTLEKVGVQNGEPAVVVTMTQRFDLSKDAEAEEFARHIVPIVIEEEDITEGEPKENAT